MKLLLHDHISDRTVGEASTERGHDVQAIDSEPEVLQLAAAEGRISQPWATKAWVRVCLAKANRSPKSNACALSKVRC
jgi:hypothetical protein